MPLKTDLFEFAKIGILSGLLGGFILGILLYIWNVPLILEAEKFETKYPNPVQTHEHTHSHATEPHSHESSSTAKSGEQIDPGRNLWTFFGALLLGLAFGILSSLWMYFASPTEASDLASISKTALFAFLFGISGFLIFFAIPAIGLPPELPGRTAAASDYETRQTWWYLCVGSSFSGFLSFSLIRSYTNFSSTKRWIFSALALFTFLAIPFLYGVPELGEVSRVPETLRAEFITITWTTNFLFWIAISFSFLFLLRTKIQVPTQAENL